MTLDAIKEAIADLPAEERIALAAWLTGQDMDEWDREMQKDFSPAGRGTGLVEKVKTDIRAGKYHPMDEKRLRKR